MLKDTAVSNAIYLQLLGWTRAGYDMALARGEIAFAFGVARPAFHGQHPLLDAVAEMATLQLSHCLGRKAAARAVRENWEMIQRAVERTEDDARLYTKAGIPSNQHIFLGVCAESNESVLAEAGLAHDVLTKLSVVSTLPGQSFFKRICGVPIPHILGQLRYNARAGIALPERFTVSCSDPAAYERWHTEIEEYRRLSHRRFEARKKAQRARARRTQVMAQESA